MKLILTLFFFLLSTQIYSNPLNKIVIFGDSLSDNGNFYKLYKIPQSPPYYKGRFSNGPIWAELLADFYFPKKADEHLFDMAFAGALVSEEDKSAVFSLKFEIDNYLKIHQAKADEKSLYVIWIGANNYLMTPKNVNETLALVDKGIRKGLQDLIHAGAKHIMVFNLPDLGMSPFPEEQYSGNEAVLARSKLSFYCRRHNEILLDTINQYKRIYPNIQLLYFDASSKFGNVVKFPENYGIENTNQACYSSKIEKTTKNLVFRLAAPLKTNFDPARCDHYLFFDAVHPSAAGHRMIAKEAKAFLDAEGVEFVLPAFR